VGDQIADGIATARLRAAYERRQAARSARSLTATDATAAPPLGLGPEAVPVLDPAAGPVLDPAAGPDVSPGRDTVATARAATVPSPADAQAPATPPAWLERIGLAARDASRFPRHFSGGQRQRIAAARAMAAHPNVLIGDEPISALDASTQAKVAHLMCTMAAELGTSLLFISHDLSIVRLVADRLIVMYQGHVVERGPTEQVWSDPLHPYTKALLGAIPAPDGAGRLPEAAPPGVTYSLTEVVRSD
jgi:ABC-type dipeptide/oligopeptide/nickel transport system ATPase component